MFERRKFHYWSYRDGVCGTISGRTAICALKKEFGLDDIVWSHGSIVGSDTSHFIATDIERNCQFEIMLRELDSVTGEELR
jgi:hypothetical protein